MTTALTDIERYTLEEYAPVAKIFVDDAYARALSDTHVQRLVSEWDRDKLGVVYLSLRDDGRYACLDGHHRVTACRIVEGEDARIPARVYIDLSVEQEAELFDAYNRIRRRPTPNQTLKARIAYGDRTALSVQAIVQQCGLTISFDGRPGKGTLKAVAALEAAYLQHGHAMLQDVLVTLRRGWGGDGAEITGTSIKGLAAFLLRYNGACDRARLLTILQANSPTQMLAKANAWRSLSPSMQEFAAWGRALRELYNDGLRSRQLPEWEERRQGEAAKERLRPMRIARLRKSIDRPA